MKKVIAIIGGMGPFATSDLFDKILLNADATKDQDFPRVLVDCNTGIEDRTEFILNRGTNPLNKIISTAANLQKMGADILCMPCNTAHYFYDDIASNVKIPIINMIEETLKFIKNKGYEKILLLATEGTVKSKIYEKYNSNYNINILNINKEEQQIVNNIIYEGVKAGRDDIDVAPLLKLLVKYKAAGVEGFILGCTELPILFKKYNIDCFTIDPTVILARAAVIYSGYAVKQEY